MSQHNTNLNSIWGVKGLIVTWSNLVIMWKVRLHMGIIFLFPLGLRWFSQGWLYFGHILAIGFSNLCQGNTNLNLWYII